MLSTVKAIAVQALRLSGNPELVKLADWIDDAGKAAITAVAKIIAESLRSSGKITDSAAQKLLKVRDQAANATITPADAPVFSATPFLDQYRDLINFVASVASWKYGLLLRGFIHSSDCSSLWLFPEREVPDVAIRPGNALTEPFLDLRLNEVQIYLLDSMADVDLQALNEELGWCGDELPATLSTRTRFEIVSQKSVRTSDGRELPIDKKTHSGVSALVDSLPVAMQARESSLQNLVKIVQGRRDEA